MTDVMHYVAYEIKRGLIKIIYSMKSFSLLYKGHTGLALTRYGEEVLVKRPPAELSVGSTREMKGMPVNTRPENGTVRLDRNK